MTNIEALLNYELLDSIEGYNISRVTTKDTGEFCWIEVTPAQSADDIFRRVFAKPEDAKDYIIQELTNIHGQ